MNLSWRKHGSRCLRQLATLYLWLGNKVMNRSVAGLQDLKVCPQGPTSSREALSLKGSTASKLAPSAGDPSVQANKPRETFHI